MGGLQQIQQGESRGRDEIIDSPTRGHSPHHTRVRQRPWSPETGDGIRIPQENPRDRESQEGAWVAEGQRKYLAYREKVLIPHTEKNILTFTLRQTEKEIAEMEEDIRNLEQKIRDKINPTKLAQTRLENRTYRPNVELCRDEPQYGLTDEVKQLAATKAALEEKLRQAQWVVTLSLMSWVTGNKSTAIIEIQFSFRHTLDGLQKELHRINDDLAIKNNSLMLDNRCMASRDKLNVRPKTTVENNRVLTGVHRERSMYLA